MVEPSDEEKARMLQEEDLGRTIRFIAEMPAHVCINELVITPVWNRLYLGGDDLKRMAPRDTTCFAAPLGAATR